MIAASEPEPRRKDAKLLVVRSDARLRHASRTALTDFLHSGDLLVANDAATLPASLAGVHLPTAAPIEVRLAGRRSLRADDVREFSAVVFGAGDFRTRTEDRSLPPLLAAGDRLLLGLLTAHVVRLLGHPRLVLLRFEGSPDAIWAGIARHGRPIQYAHVGVPLALWDVWTPFAGSPAAFEPPSAGFALDWRILAQLRTRCIGFATITHAAGISSTGDAALDARLPLDEPYNIPETTADAIRRARAAGGRIVAVGTTVVRALEHAGPRLPASGLATQRIGPNTRLRLVDAVLSGTHEPGSSHYELLRAFVPDELLKQVNRELNSHAYRTHEFGDSVLVEKISRLAAA